MRVYTQDASFDRYWGYEVVGNPHHAHPNEHIIAVAVIPLPFPHYGLSIFSHAGAQRRERGWGCRGVLVEREEWLLLICVRLQKKLSADGGFVHSGCEF